MSHDLRGNDVFCNFAAYAGKGDWTVVLWIGFISFFEHWCDESLSPIKWKGLNIQLLLDDEGQHIR